MVRFQRFGTYNIPGKRGMKWGVTVQVTVYLENKVQVMLTLFRGAGIDKGNDARMVESRHVTLMAFVHLPVDVDVITSDIERKLRM